ncbi:MAG: polyphosphate polymerase domain-containing protein [Candidatus Ventricola sp.]
MPTIRNIPLRHELKYHITPAELTVLRGVLAPVMQLDPNGNENNEYHIRSLYFDTINDDALEEKIAGVGNRKKYRIRIYNFSDKVIKLECKSKYGDLISKQSVSIPRELAEQLIAGDPDGLQRMRHPLLHDVYREMRTRLLRPAVIVDYVREAYIHQAEEVRITFDKQVRTGLYSVDLFNPQIPTYPVFDDPVEILEVKFDEFLPSYLQSILSGITAQRSAVSKYTWCRRYENKEY